MITTLTRMLNGLSVMMLLLTVAYVAITFSELFNHWFTLGILASASGYSLGYLGIAATLRAREDNGY